MPGNGEDNDGSRLESLRNQVSQLSTDMEKMRGDLSREMTQMRGDLEKQIESLRGDIKGYKVVQAVLLVLLGAVLAGIVGHAASLF